MEKHGKTCLDLGVSSRLSNPPRLPRWGEMPSLRGTDGAEGVTRSSSDSSTAWWIVCFGGSERARKWGGPEICDMYNLYNIYNIYIYIYSDIFWLFNKCQDIEDIVSTLVIWTCSLDHMIPQCHNAHTYIQKTRNEIRLFHRFEAAWKLVNYYRTVRKENTEFLKVFQWCRCRFRCLQLEKRRGHTRPTWCAGCRNLYTRNEHW